MTIVELIRRINLKLNYGNFDFDDLSIQLDEAVDTLNDFFKIDLDMISGKPLYMEKPGVNYKEYTQIDWIADEILRRFVIPYVAGAKLTTLGRDASPELMQAQGALSQLAMKYRPELGDTSLIIPTFEGAYENQDVQFSGDDNYGYGDTNNSNSMALTDPFRK